MRAIIEHRLQRRHALQKGGSDDIFQLRESVENDGEQAASDFKLELDIPSELIHEAPPLGLSRPAPLGFSRFEITNEDGPGPDRISLSRYDQPASYHF